MLAWAFDDEEPELWFPSTSMPERLLNGLRNSNIKKVAFNSAFERNCLDILCGIKIPASEFEDPQASARYLSLPAHLSEVGEALGLPLELTKDKQGKELMKIFSFPHTRTKKDDGGTYFYEPADLPEEFKAYGEYCKQDVRTEREVVRRLTAFKVFPLPERERAIWLFDQKVNDRGIPVDRNFVQKLFTISDRNKDEKKKEQNVSTGLENANSTDQLLPWVRERGYPLKNLRKSNIELVLKDPEVKLTQECRDVLEARMEAGSISYKKLSAILRNLSPDDRLRYQFIFMGSSRCGRWSGDAVQLHNMARPDNVFEDLDNVIKARNFVYLDDYASLTKIFYNEKKKRNYSPLEISRNIIRTVFVAPQGKRFNVCDLNAIETRVGAWVAECPALLQVFLDGKDPYVEFATKMTGILYDVIKANLKSPDPAVRAAAKRMRQIAKPAVLGAIYRLSAGGWGFDKNRDRIKTGMWGYAENMGIDMTLEQCTDVVKVFRESYPEICAPPSKEFPDRPVGIWFRLEEAVFDVLKGGKRMKRFIGPNGCIKIDKLTRTEPNLPILRIQLPSGRYLHYMDASIQNTAKPWMTKKKDEYGQYIKDEHGEDVLEQAHGPSFTYFGKDQHTGIWTLIVSHGGKIFENIVQAIARDVLADKLLEFESIGLEVVAHVHDEGITLSDDDPFAPGILEMKAIMNKPVIWAPSLPLGSDGFEDFFYHK
jgi:DNA polymerase